jgi:hypothetical protein
MPTLISVNTAAVPTSLLVDVDTIPGNIIDLGANVTLLGFNTGAVEFIYSDDLLGAVSAVPYIWENRNASIRLPLGVNETSVFVINDILFSTKHISPRSLFSTPSNVSSSEYVIADPYAHSLSVRCGVVPLPADAVIDNFSLEYHGPNMKGAYNFLVPPPRLTFFCGVVTLHTFNDSILSIYAAYQYTRSDGVVPSFTAATNIQTEPGILQFGGEKHTHNSPPDMVCECCIWFLRRSIANVLAKVQDVVLRSYPGANSSAAIAERGSVSFLYVSLNPDALSFPSGVDYASPIKEAKNLTIISWVNDTKHSTDSRSRLPALWRRI